MYSKSAEKKLDILVVIAEIKTKLFEIEEAIRTYKKKIQEDKRCM